LIVPSLTQFTGTVQKEDNEPAGAIFKRELAAEEDEARQLWSFVNGQATPGFMSMLAALKMAQAGKPSRQLAAEEDEARQLLNYTGLKGLTKEDLDAAILA